jgi:hypothetical protein
VRTSPDRRAKVHAWAETEQAFGTRGVLSDYGDDAASAES